MASYRQAVPPTPRERLVARAGYAFFFLSGAMALIYEVLWVRLLGLVFGNTTHAISTVLTAYMAGLGLGSYWIGRSADRWRHPLTSYGAFEIGIGAYAALTFPILKGIQALYVLFAQQFQPGPALFTTVRLLLSFAILFIPTFFMGATLPVLAKFYVRRTEAIGAGTALLYGLNTAGAVAGTLLSGFLFLPLLGMKASLIMAVTLNVGIGLLAVLLSRDLAPLTTERPPPQMPSAPAPHQPGSVRAPSGLAPWLLGGLVVSGATAMIYEVGWTRVLATVLGSSTYAFTLMLATFLCGLALGSAAYERVLMRRAVRLADWSWLQITISLFALGTLPLFERVDILTLRLFAFTIGHPGWLEVMRFLVCGALMIVPTCCFGALFPVSAALYTRDAAVLGRGLGTVYLANTCGNILGSLAVGFLLIPTVGIHRALTLAIALGGLVGLAAAFADARRTLRRPAAAIAATLVLVAGLWSSRSGWDPALLTAGFHVRPSQSIGQPATQLLDLARASRVLFYREGLNSIVSVHQLDDERYLKVNGKTDASTSRDLLTQVLVGHLPHLLHPDPRRTFIIGFGSGSTLNAALAHPVSQVDCAEIEPAVLAAAPYFERINHRADRDPRTRLILNDARNQLLIERGAYDVIISEPSNPWMAGVATLFSVEFYEQVRRHLAPQGLFCQWLQAYNIDPRDVQMVVASVQRVFPHVTIWEAMPSDFLLIAGNDPLVVDFDRIAGRLNRSPALKRELAAVGIHGAAGLLSLFQLGEADARAFSRDARLNTDDQLWLEFSAPWALYAQTTDLVRAVLASFRAQRFPALRTTGPPLDQQPAALLQIAEGYLQEERNLPGLARPYLEQALALDPQLAAAHAGLGRCDMAQGRLLSAIAAFERAARLDDRSADARWYLGRARLRGGDGEAGLASLREAVSLDDGRWELHYWEGVVLERLQRFAEAAEAYRRSMALEPPRSLPVRLAYARSLIRAGRPQEAVTVLEALRREYVTTAPVYGELINAYERLGDVSPAIAVYEQLIAINPYHAQYWVDLVHLYNKHGDTEQALRAIYRARRRHPYFLALLRAQFAPPPADTPETAPLTATEDRR
ncbi:MAG: fused MFS/spermidine synthase [Candidatus Omnitrophica bacterium]|nr:fused MFS/spermidine synthase [Candidatus Omnitrophota bacterium]